MTTWQDACDCSEACGATSSSSPSSSSEQEQEQEQEQVQKQEQKQKQKQEQKQQRGKAKADDKAKAKSQGQNQVQEQKVKDPAEVDPTESIFSLVVDNIPNKSLPPRVPTNLHEEKAVFLRRAARRSSKSDGPVAAPIFVYGDV